MIGRILRAIAAPPPAPRPSGGGMPWQQLYPELGGSGLVIRRYPPPRSIAAATSPVSIALANAARVGLAVINDSTANLYIGLGAGVSTIAYDAKLGPGQTFVLGPPGAYQGDVVGVWDAVNGSARVTETT